MEILILVISCGNYSFGVNVRRGIYGPTANIIVYKSEPGEEQNYVETLYLLNILDVVDEIVKFLHNYNVTDIELDIKYKR